MQLLCGEKIIFLRNDQKTGWLAHILWYRLSFSACNGEVLHTLFLRQKATGLMGADAIGGGGDHS